MLRTGNHVRFVTNLNGLLRFPWINGVKTGHTLDAGYVLVASGTQGGMTLVDAVLGTSSEAARDANALRAAQLGVRQLRRADARPRRQGAGAAGGHGDCARSARRARRLIAASTYTHVFPRSASVTLRVHAPAELTGPLPAQSAVGWVSVVDESPGRYPHPAAAGIGRCRRSSSPIRSQARWSYRLRCRDFWWQWVRRSG